MHFLTVLHRRLAQLASACRPHLLPAVLLVGLVVAALGISLEGEFVWDDRPLIVENRLIKSFDEIPSILTSSFWDTGDRHDRFRGFFRPVISVSYALDYFIWGLRPFGYHLTNLMLHWACCLLVYLLAAQEGLPRGPALAAASLFAVHPVHVESVTWISGRTDLLCALFFLAALLAHRRFVAGAPWQRVLPLLLFTLALFSKEMAATFPALIFILSWFGAGTRPQRFMKGLRAALPYGAVLVLYLLVRKAALGPGAEPLFTLAQEAYVATGIFVLARYLLLLFLPAGLDAHYPYQPLDELFGPVALLSLGILVVLAVIARHLGESEPRSRYWMAWVVLSLAPVFKFGAFGDVLLADRFLYLPSVGFVMALTWAGVAALRTARPAWQRATAIGLVLSVAVFSSWTWSRAQVWRDDLTLFAKLRETSPDSALVRCNLGLALYARGEYDAAKSEFKESIRLIPGFAMGHNNLAASLEREGDLDGALAHYQEAVRQAPLQVEGWVNIGRLMVQTGDRQRGMDLLRQVNAEHPDYPPGLYALGQALFETGDIPGAVELFERVVAVDPFYPHPHYMFGKIFFEKGEFQAAADAMRRFLPLWNEAGVYRDTALSVIAQVEAMQAAGAVDLLHPPPAPGSVGQPQ